MNPAQAPQLLAGMKAGVFQSELRPFGITPVAQPIDGPPRAFHALQRSKWPFIYVTLTVFLNYSRTEQNEGGAGGLQYVAIAGSAAGGEPDAPGARLEHQDSGRPQGQDDRSADGQPCGRRTH